MPRKESKNPRVVVSPSIGKLNPYLFSVYSRLPQHGFNVEGWRDYSLLGHIDVLHINWPDTHLGRRAGLHGLRRYLKFVAFLRALRIRGTKVCWTAHNLRPHDLSMSKQRWDERFAHVSRYFDGVVYLTTASIDVVQSTFPGLISKPSVVIPHPNYGDVVSPVSAEGKGRLKRLLSLGKIAPYKCLPHALEVMRGEPSIDWTLAGECGDDRLRAELTSRDLNVSVQFGRLSHQEIEALAATQDAVLITQIEFLNSGVLFLGLSLGLPVIAPRTSVTQEVQGQVGKDWLRLYDPPLTLQGLRGCLGSFGGGPPPLQMFAPEEVSARTAAFYRRLLAP
jgi:beta-1,4-mannosyltransferase